MPKLPRPAAPLLAAALAACTGAAPSTGPAPAAAAPGATQGDITAADVRHRLEIVAHDSMEGRDTGSRGIRATADYIVREAQRLGLRPAGDDGGWFDQVSLVRRATAFTAEHGATAFGPSDIVPVSGMAGLPGATRTQGGGRLVYGGWVVDPAGGPALTPEQMQGAVLVLRFGAAPGAQGAPRYNVGQLFGPGSPLAGLILVGEGDLREFWDYASGIVRRGEVIPADSASAGETGTAPMVFLASPQAAERMVGRPLDGAPAAADLGTFRYTVQRSTSPIEAFNVVAVLPGRDAAQASQYVAIGSHYDHDGYGPPVDGDSLYNGADDDGSGTVGMLEIAERLVTLPAAQRPARSVLFVWHTAEEKGLLGSEQFTRNPSVPRESIVAQLNIDMIGRNSPDSVYLVGSRRLSTELGDLVEAVNTRQARPFSFDYSWDAPNHPERIYCRSDHYNYARYGIPVTFFTTGLHPDYHKPSDEVERVDFDKVARISRLIGDITLEVANRPARPVVDKPVPPLGTPCT